jgi:hypothetical protein
MPPQKLMRSNWGTDHEQTRVDRGLGVAICACGIFRDAGSREACGFTELGIQIQWVGVPGPILPCSWAGGILRGYRFTHPESSQIRSDVTDRRHDRSNGYAFDPPRAAGRDHISPSGTARGRFVYAPRNDCRRFKRVAVEFEIARVGFDGFFFNGVEGRSIRRRLPPIELLAPWRPQWLYRPQDDSVRIADNLPV